MAGQYVYSVRLVSSQTGVLMRTATQSLEAVASASGGEPLTQHMDHDRSLATRADSLVGTELDQRQSV